VVSGTSDNLLIKPEKAANARGARDMGLAPVAGGLGLAAILDAAANGEIRALYVCGSDVWETAGRQQLEEALKRLECLIVQDIARSPLADFAHIVLPSLTFAEKSGTFTNVAGRVQRLHRAINPPEGQLDDGMIFSRLLAQITEGVPTFDPVAVLQEVAGAVPAYAGLTPARIGASGWQLAGGTTTPAPAGAPA